MTVTKQPSDFKTYVLMPFGNNNEYPGGNAESDFVYNEIIKPAVTLALNNSEAEPNIIREVDRNRSGSINNSMFRDLLDSDVVIVDITGRNPNVFMELGIRYALRNKITIMIAQEGTVIPFDIQGYRYISYSRYKPDDARRTIAQFIREGFQDERYSDSVVFNVFPTMSVVIPGLIESLGLETLENREVMRWEDYLARVEWICELLRNPVRDGRYAPDAVFGISNGGLIVADLVGRELFRGTPILSLWANRFKRTTESSTWFFDSVYNDAVMDALTGPLKKDIKEILLFDDHLGTGHTAWQATAYIKKRLGEQTSILFIPLVSPRIQYYDDKVVEQYLPYNYRNIKDELVFNITKNEFITKLNTEFSHFPYFKKEISKGP